MDTPLISDTDTLQTNWVLRAWSSCPCRTVGAGNIDEMDDSPVAISSDVVFHVADFVGGKQYLFFALVSKDWRTAWGRRPTLTTCATPHTSVSQLRYSIDCGLKKAIGWRGAKHGAVFASLARSGNLELLKVAYKSGCHLNYHTCEVAAECGHLEVLKWATKRLGVWRSCKACSAAAKGGHLHVLQWAKHTGYEWDKTTCSSAAEGGHLDVLQWARERGCPWDEGTCQSAAMGGHLTLLTWARAHGCPWNTRTCVAAAGKSPHIIRWARGRGCPWDEETCSKLAGIGDLATLLWARENGCPWDERASRSAAVGGHLTVLTWARTQGCPWNALTCAAAATGSPHILRWARDNGCPWDGQTCFNLAKVGDLATLRWARGRGCPWGPEVFRAAAKGGHAQVLQYARDTGCPTVAFGENSSVSRMGRSVQQYLCQDAAAGGHLHALQWAVENGYGWCGGECTAAARGGHLEVLRWAREHGCPWDHRTVMAAANNGHAEVLRWARENGCPLPPNPPKPGCCHCPEFWEYHVVGRCLSGSWVGVYCLCYYLPGKWYGLVRDRVSSCLRSRRVVRGRGNRF